MSYSGDALDVVLNEVRRIRDLQSARISNLQSRAGVQIGASGIAAALVSSVASNEWWLLPIAGFVLAALFGVLTIAPRAGYLLQPQPVFDQAAGIGATQVKVQVIAGLLSEYQVQEGRLAWPAVFERVGAVLFVIAIALVLVVAAVSGLGDSVLEPIKVQIVEE